MNLSKHSSLIICASLGIAALTCWVWYQGAERREMERINPWLKLQREREEQCEKQHAEERRMLSLMLKTQQVSKATQPYKLVTGKDQMSPEEKATLEKDFKEKFQPVLAKWINAYEGRIPFKFEDFTLGSFHSRVYTATYTFVIGDTTLCINSSESGTKVEYLMNRTEAIQMNSVPDQGFVPDINTPVTREQAIELVKKDTGVVFKPNEVLVKPSAMSTALNGGVFIDFLPSGADPENGLNYKVSLVFRSDGMLVSYLRKAGF